MLVGRRGEHLAGAGQDVHLQHRLVRQTVAERGGLDAEPGDRPAERDRLQLRHHQRRQPVGQRGGDEVLVCTHPGHIGGPGVGIDRDDARQPRCVQAPDSVLGPRPEQVRRGFGQPNRGVFRDGPIARDKPLHARGVSSPCVGRGNSHRYTLVRGPRMPWRDVTSGGVHSPGALPHTNAPPEVARVGLTAPTACTPPSAAAAGAGLDRLNRRGHTGAHAAWSSPNDTWQIRERFSVSHLVRALLLDGGAKGTRTPDLLVANETRYQLRHSPADRWADQHRDFTTVRPRQTCAFRRLRHRSRCLWKPPERPLSPGLQDSARWPRPDRKGQWYGRSGERAAWKHKSAW